MRKNWFTLNADIFLWVKNHVGLAYNTGNKKRFLFPLSEGIKKVCHQLLKTENLYTTELTDEDMNDKEIQQWIHSLIEIRAGYLSYNIEFEKRPISLMPILKVQDQMEHYEWQHMHKMGGEILQNLHELTFYICESKYGNNEYFKQYIFPLKNSKVLDCSAIYSFICNSRNPFLSNINLVGNLFSYPDFEKFINKICSLSIQCTIHIMAQDFWDNIQKVKEINWPFYIQFNLLFDSVFDISSLHDIFLPFHFTAFIFSEKDYIQLENMLEEEFFTDRNIRVIPLYNRKNLSFFESNVYIEKEELENIDLTRNEIFMKQALNTLNFGKLTVMSDGYVYANVNANLLGTIYNSPYSLVYKEFTEGTSWFKIRNQMPCTDCIYQWLCPSPSNYETVIGKTNLCHIKQ